MGLAGGSRAYSIGKDLEKHGGTIDSDYDRKRGDLVFGLNPPIARQPATLLFNGVVDELFHAELGVPLVGHDLFERHHD